MRAFIITEGNSRTGFGHIARCSSLFEAFEASKITPEFIINGDRNSADVLGNKKHRTLDWLKKKQSLLDIIKDADIAIVDSYLADPGIYEDISNSVRVSAYLDDNKRIDYPKGIVVNGAIHAGDMGYPEKEGITYLLGVRYMLLRREFWDVPVMEISDSLKTVLVTFGGVDARNLTPKVLRDLIDNYSGLKKKVIVGKGFQNIQEIEKIKDSETELIYYPDAEGIKKAMLGSDIAISAGGQTLNELARIGLPTIVVSVAENQAFNVAGWLDAGFVEYAGSWEDNNILKSIRAELEKLKDLDLRKTKYQTGKDLASGNGSLNVVDYLLHIC